MEAALPMNYLPQQTKLLLSPFLGVEVCVVWRHEQGQFDEVGEG
jgi:hypothetical protein